MRDLTTAWLAQLVVRQSAVRGVEGLNPRQDRFNPQVLKITEENVVPM